MTEKRNELNLQFPFPSYINIRKYIETSKLLISIKKILAIDNFIT